MSGGIAHGLHQLPLAIHVQRQYDPRVLAIRLDPEIERRLALLAKKTGRTKTYYAREAILEHLEDLEDGYLALERLKKLGRIYTSDEVKRELGL